MVPYTFGTLLLSLQSWAEDYSADYQASLPEIIRNAELRCLRDLDLDNLDYASTTTAITQSTGLVTKPTQLIRDRDIVLVNATPANLALLLKRSYAFVTEYLIAAAGAQGPPKYIAEYSPTQWQVAPLPDASTYTLSVRGIYPPALIGDNDQQNFAVAVLQHTTATVAMTLVNDFNYDSFAAGATYGTTSPPTTVPGGYIVSSQLSLTSTGNMSANQFTIAGLDPNGVALSVVLAGPNANTVTTAETFSEIISITPSVTDNSNEVAAYFLSANMSWLSTRYPDLLFYSCMVDACHYLKRFSARAVAQNEYAGRLTDVQTQVRLLKRSDLDDIFVSRQLINGPGMGPPEMPPAAPAAQQPQPGAQ